MSDAVMQRATLLSRIDGNARVIVLAALGAIVGGGGPAVAFRRNIAVYDLAEGRIAIALAFVTLVCVWLIARTPSPSRIVLWTLVASSLAANALTLAAMVQVVQTVSRFHVRLNVIGWGLWTMGAATAVGLLFGLSRARRDGLLSPSAARR